MIKKDKKTDLRGLKIAEGALIATLVSAIALFIIGPDRIYLFFDSFKQADREEQEAYRAKIENLRLQAKLNEEREKLDRVKSAQREQMLLGEKRQQQLELIAKIAQSDAESKEKQAKWERFYQQSPSCKTPKDWRQNVECANELMKAEERFEALYKAGKL